jgi:two-component system sensor histidine kinase KdpD
VGAEERVFDKFHRGAHAGIEGVGLGLPICRAIAEAHSGSLRVFHRDNGGATFALRMPIGGVPPPMPEEG